MRIISGKNRGRKIIAPSGLPVRPTTDMAKESLFNILQNEFDLEALTILDLFAGTGNISYEFASRGCISVTSVDISYKSVAFIRQTAEKLKFENLKVIQADYKSFIKHASSKYSLIFADPPYDMKGIENIPKLIFSCNLLSDSGILIVEHDKQLDFSTTTEFSQHKKYGKVNFSFFEDKKSEYFDI